MDKEYWNIRYASGCNYDTMVGWSKETVEDETKILWEAMRSFWGSGQIWEKVMDFGCGCGRFFPYFAELGTVYVGTDILDELIDDNQTKYPKAYFDYMDSYKEWDLTNLVFIFTVFQYFTDEEANHYLKVEFKNAEDIFICESLANEGVVLRPHEHNRQPKNIKIIAENCGWKIHKEVIFNSRERYYFLWLKK